jgi:hypothetical protein
MRKRLPGEAEIFAYKKESGTSTMKMTMKKAPMGWNSYDYYDTTVTEEQVKANADYMAANLKDCGWEYVVVDIQWYAKDAGSRRSEFQYIPFGDMEMDGYGRYQPAVNRFPSAAEGRGFGPLADYVHSLGLKFGIHIMRGIPRLAAHQHLPIAGCSYTAADAADPASVCGWNPDMYGVRDNAAGRAYYDGLIGMYADWGVDFIKCDDICDSWMYRNDSFSGWHETKMLHEAIEKSGRDIVLSLSPGPAHIDRAWQYGRYANMWRITDDFWDKWELLANMFYRCELWQDHVAEGCYPDCDMLPLGKLGGGFGRGEWDTNFTREEQKAMLTLWCVFGSPLMVGAELTKLDEWTKWLLTRKDILKLTGNAYAGKQMERDESHAIWSCMNEETGERYLAFFNLGEGEAVISCCCARVEQFARAGRAQVQEALELWSGERRSVAQGMLTAQVPAHGAKLFELS